MSTPIAQRPTEIDLKTCFDKEFEAYGTQWLFEQRALRLGTKLKALSWVTFAVPIAVAALLTTLDNPSIALYTKIGSGLLSGVVGLFGLAALVGNWSDALAVSQRSMTANSRLLEDWKEVKQLTGNDFLVAYNKVLAHNIAQENIDKIAGVSDREKRRSMRKALMQYSLACVTCHEKPTSIKSQGSKCSTCGDC
jgi:mobilome CxxCx(11)CxxC protein